MSQLVLHIESNNPQDFKQKIKELYEEFFPKVETPEPVYTRLPTVRMGHNTLTSFDKVYDHIKATTEIGCNFSSTSIRMALGMENSRMQNALGTIRNKGLAKMLQKGIWQRII